MRCQGAAEMDKALSQFMSKPLFSFKFLLLEIALPSFASFTRLLNLFVLTAGTCKVRSHERTKDDSFSSTASSLESLLIPGRTHQILIKARLTLTLNVWGSGLGKWTCLRRTTFLFLSMRGATTIFSSSNTCKTLCWYASTRAATVGRVMFTIYVWEIQTYGFWLLSCSTR